MAVNLEVELKQAQRKAQGLQSQLDTARGEVERYNELIMAVASKYPDESRHETALKYITEREGQTWNTAQHTGNTGNE